MQCLVLLTINNILLKLFVMYSSLLLSVWLICCCRFVLNSLDQKWYNRTAIIYVMLFFETFNDYLIARQCSRYSLISYSHISNNMFILYTFAEKVVLEKCWYTSYTLFESNWNITTNFEKLREYTSINICISFL